nr:hypothetical protein [Tanacetum cinerariifolium]
GPGPRHRHESRAASHPRNRHAAQRLGGGAARPRAAAPGNPEQPANRPRASRSGHFPAAGC